MSIVGKNVLFNNTDVETPTWGKVMDSVLAAIDDAHGHAVTKYVVQAVVTMKQSETRTSDETIITLVLPSQIELIEDAPEKKNL